MKNIMIAGGIGKDAELRTMQNGDKVAGFSVAVESRANGEKSTTWFDCSLFGKRAEALSQYLTKGSRVAVSGDLGTREYNGKTYLTVRASEVTLLGGGQSAGQSGGHSDPARQAPDGYGAGGRPSGDIEDEIPFNMEWRL